MKNTNPQEETTKINVKRGGRGAIRVLIALVIILAGASVYFFRQYSTLRANPQAKSQEETAKIVAQVSKFIVLPSETPTVATVTDVVKLKDQPFFANAKNGDKVLIYTAAKKAILFDPVANKIVEVAPINIGNNSSTKTPVSTTTSQTTTTTTTAPKN